MNDALRDKFVCGIENPLNRKQLLSKHNLTVASALELAPAMEAAGKESEKMVIDIGKSDARIKGESNFRMDVQNKTTKMKCYRCDNENHLSI